MLLFPIALGNHNIPPFGEIIKYRLNFQAHSLQGITYMVKVLLLHKTSFSRLWPALLGVNVAVCCLASWTMNLQSEWNKMRKKNFKWRRCPTMSAVYFIWRWDTSLEETLVHSSLAVSTSQISSTWCTESIGRTLYIYSFQNPSHVTQITSL